MACIIFPLDSAVNIICGDPVGLNVCVISDNCYNCQLCARGMLTLKII